MGCKRIIFLFLILSALASCENYTSCSGTVGTSMGISFHQIMDSTESDTILPALTVTGIGRTGSFYAKDTGLQIIRLPLSEIADSTAFYIQPDTTVQGDTIHILYNRNLHFVSSGCGFATYFNIDTIKYTRHSIDSIAIPVKTITTTDAKNVKIYYNK